MTVIQAIELNIYTMRTLRSDESAKYIALVRTSVPDPSVRDTDGDDLRSAGIYTDDNDDVFMSIPKDDSSDRIRACGRYATARVHSTKCECA